MIQIQPYVFPILGTATQLSVVVQAFNTTEKNCSLSYSLLTDEGIHILDDYYVLTEEQFSEWAADNSYLNNLVANKLGVTIIN